jgi:hypothetical protein
MAGPKPAHAHNADPGRAAIVVSRAVVRAAAVLGINSTTLARVLGISAASTSRLKDGAYVLPPDSKPYELALLLIRLFRSLDAMMGGEEPSIRSWMRVPNQALRGVPQDLVTSVTGLVDTVTYVDAARARL